ncbi:MAG: hypothetical protein LBC98_00270 [Prevotellaceae bacterium]|jgi:predicted acyltransferase|nr:hypothetical protein [Prevotellaceae bacterium]
MKDRILSIDFFRGFIMFLLIAETTGLYYHTGWTQMIHHPWHGLRFWDLIQPFFMFIVGVAMPVSLARRQAKGINYGMNFKHIAKRCLILLAMGTGLQCVYSRKLVWELWNVLTQLSVTIIITYLLIRLKPSLQFAISLCILAASDAAYRFFPLEGFDQPFVIDKNFGTWMDLILMGKINQGGGWVAVNCIPTAAHTIWGAIAGQILLNQSITKFNKLKLMSIYGIALLIVGYGFDLAGISPIIKRISTLSFVIVSGGWAFLALAFCFWIVDVARQTQIVKPFAVIGVNSILIYLLTQSIGAQWFNGCVNVFLGGFMETLGCAKLIRSITVSLAILAMEWLFCLYLYRKSIFVKV